MSGAGKGVAVSSSAPSYFRSKVFIRLFLSYVLIIVVFVAFYCAWYVRSYASHREDLVMREAQQQTKALGTLVDQQILSAQSLCAAINSSDSCREILQTAYIERKTIDSMQLFRVLNELKRIKGSSNNMNIYNLMLCFAGDSKAFSAGTVLDFTGEAGLLDESPTLRVTTVRELLGVESSTAVVMNKGYLIYADNYSITFAGSAMGTVLVLLEKSGLTSTVRGALEAMSGAEVLYRGEPLLSVGEESSHAFTCDSLVLDGLSYRAYLPQSALSAPLLSGALVPVLGMVLVGLVFILITSGLSRRYYRPIGNIGQMIEREDGSSNEIEDILRGVRNLIGERNGYREKMITISPYARQGMLHSLLNGDVRNAQLDVLIDEHFIALRKAAYMLAIVSIANLSEQEISPQHLRDAQALIAQVCREMTTDEMTVVSCMRDLQNLFVIVSGDEEADLENAFYALYSRIIEALDDERFAVTIGVSHPESDLGHLQDACADAQAALQKMLVGGRSSVYFAESAHTGEERRYYFPKDAQKRMVRDLRARDLSALQATLEEIYRRNVVEAELPLAEVRSMVDELHLTIRNALRDVYDRGTTHIRIERIHEAATVDEIFAYYRTALQTALTQDSKLAGSAKPGALAKDVCDYIDQNALSPELSLSAIAARFGVSTKVVGDICKSAYGQTFLQVVHEKQIRRAVELLQTTDKPLEEIAQECGFTNLLTFRRNFKAVMNMNPSDYRK